MQRDFNSIKVRLERAKVRNSFECDPNFNSIKVRLERYSRVAIANLQQVFQFHKGTIRTSMCCCYCCVVTISIP